MSLKCEPFSEPLHFSVQWVFLNLELCRTVQLSMWKFSEWSVVAHKRCTWVRPDSGLGLQVKALKPLHCSLAIKRHSWHGLRVSPHLKEPYERGLCHANLLQKQFGSWFTAKAFTKNEITAHIFTTQTLAHMINLCSTSRWQRPFLGKKSEISCLTGWCRDLSNLKSLDGTASDVCGTHLKQKTFTTVLGWLQDLVLKFVPATTF